jgi:hypothetical protein
MKRVERGDETIKILEALGHHLTETEAGTVRAAVSLECARAERDEAKRTGDNILRSFRAV